MTVERIMYSVKDIQEAFGISKDTAYALVRSRGFPKMTLNGRYFVPKLQLDAWVKQNYGKDIFF